VSESAETKNKRLRGEVAKLEVWLRLIRDDPLRPYMASARAELALIPNSFPADHPDVWASTQPDRKLPTSSERSGSEEVMEEAKDRLEDAVLTLWKAALEDVRLGFVSHPVDDARSVVTQLTEALTRAEKAEAERDELRAELYGAG